MGTRTDKDPYTASPDSTVDQWHVWGPGLCISDMDKEEAEVFAAYLNTAFGHGVAAGKQNR